MFRSKQKFATIMGMLMLASMPLVACKEKPIEPPKIDLQQVNEAFVNTSGASFGLWMQNFEWAVNEIYTGKELVAVDARRRNGMLHIYGFIEKNNTPGYQISDELVFAIKQFRGTFKFGYKVEDHVGWAAITKQYNTAPSFGFYGSVILVATWRPYYTPRARYAVYRTRRSSYRRGSAYAARRSRSKAFRSKAMKSAGRRSAARAARRRGGKA